MLEDKLLTRKKCEERGFEAEDECTEREQEQTWYPIAGWEYEVLEWNGRKKIKLLLDFET